MSNSEDVAKENKNEPNPNWLQIHGCPGILIIGGSESRKTNALPNLIKEQDNGDYSIINKVYLSVMQPNEAKYQYLIKKHGKMVLKT